MDQRLIAWGRAVKARTAATHPRGAAPVIPPLWLFTDLDRVTDPLPAIARLPSGLCGVVFRHDGAPGRATLGLAIARLCRARRLALVIAGDPRLAARLGAGLHVRGGQRPAGFHKRPSGFVTSSAHNLRELKQAQRAGAVLAFLSPFRPTRSHPGAPALGAVRWARLARHGSIPILALGGVDGLSARALPPFCRGAAAIDALL